MSNNKTENNTNRRRGEFIAQVVRQENFGIRSRCITFKFTGQAVPVMSKTKPGQFVNIACRRIDDPRSTTPLLRRPFSVSNIEIVQDEHGNDEVLLELIYQVLGPGTGWLERRSVDDKLNILGPLGNGFFMPEKKDSPIILVGGGVGLPPMFFLAKWLTNLGYETIHPFAGIRNVEYFSPDRINVRFANCSAETVIATDDGSYGFKGHALGALMDKMDSIENFSDATIFSCGPEPLLRGISELAEEKGVACQVCMESYMACGIGLCQSCVVEIKNNAVAENENNEPKYKLVCANGPVFHSNTVIWD